MNMFEGYEEFEDQEGTRYYFVRLIKERILAWKVIKENMHDGEAVCLGVPITEVTKEELQRLELWEGLSKKIKITVEKEFEKQKEMAATRMAHARKGRRKKYNFDGLPEKLTCHCGNTVKANYYALQKKANEQCLPLDAIIKAYKCRACKKQKKVEKELDTVN